MPSLDVQRIRQSFDVISPKFDDVAGRFYVKLFERHPDLRELFPPDLDAQRAHLGAAIALIVRNLSILEALTVPLAELGAHHAALGVCNDDYSSMANAFIAALSDVLGPSNAWSAELEDDWRRLLKRVATMMQDHSRR